MGYSFDYILSKFWILTYLKIFLKTNFNVSFCLTYLYFFLCMPLQTERQSLLKRVAGVRLELEAGTWPHGVYVQS